LFFGDFVLSCFGPTTSQNSVHALVKAICNAFFSSNRKTNHAAPDATHFFRRFEFDALLKHGDRHAGASRDQLLGETIIQ